MQYLTRFAATYETRKEGIALKIRDRAKKKSFLKKRGFLLITIVVIVGIIIAAYIAINVSPPPRRHVEAHPVIPPGLIYNDTLDELTMWLNFTPSDNNLYLSRVTIPSSSNHWPFHERVYENGTVIKFVFSNYSIYVGTPFSGAVVALDFYFSDVNTNEDIAKTEVRVKYP